MSNDRADVGRFGGLKEYAAVALVILAYGLLDWFAGAICRFFEALTGQ